MGYSIATPIKSEKAKKEMMAFLKLHYNHTLDTYARGPLDRDLSYDHGPCRIGFDGTITSDYMISMCAWIALKVGKRKMYPTKQCDKVHGPYKYIVYDGYEDWPLYIVSEWRAGLPQLMKINWVGCLVPQPQKWDRLIGRTKQLKRIEAELKRLDALWNSDSWRSIKSEFAAQRYR
jgi:hypothetical protein